MQAYVSVYPYKVLFEDKCGYGLCFYLIISFYILPQLIPCPGSFPGVKQLGREVNHSFLSNAEIKNEWSYTSSPTMCRRGVEREYFTFTFTI
jgi:hypothetical protein